MLVCLFQANFHFLLHDPTWTRGDGTSASPLYQEAFFDPDVLVDWDTVDTVRLFRKVSRRQKPVSREESTPRIINSVRASDHTKTNASGNVQASFLDRLRPQPTWKGDPNIVAVGVSSAE